MNMTQLRSLAKERKFRGYSRLRKADLINFIEESLREEPINDPMDTGIQNQPQKNEILSEVLTKRQLKRRRNKASKLSKRSKNLRIEINDLKSQKDDIEDKINKASRSTSSRFKRKKIRSMKREASKLTEKIQERTNKLKTIEVEPILQTSQLSKANKSLKKKIEDINKKIRRAKGKTNRNLMIKRDSLKLQLIDTNPKLIEGAFGGNYSKYRIDGVEGVRGFTNILFKD